MQIFKSSWPFLALALSVVIGTPARATGWIMVDPGLTPTPVLRPQPARTIFNPPWTPFLPPPPNPHKPTILKGSVSFGLHLQAQDVKVTINDQVAKTYIKQVFANDTDRNLAGTYLFPLPQDTTFSSFSLHIDGKPVEGKILEAEAARQQYEEIVRRMVDPGLLEYADYKTVRARIFPIPAHGTKTVELEYTQLLKAENGMLKYAFPLKAEGQNSPAEEIKLSVDLGSKQGLRAIWSPSHHITLDRDTDHRAKVSFLEKNSLPDKDFLLCYSVSDKDLAANLLTHKNPGEDGYYLLTLTPPLHAAKPVAKDVVFVVDTSGSMQGQKIEETKSALKYVVNALSPEDRFDIIQFNTDVDYFKPHLMQATDANRHEAASFIDGLEARGGTDISDALQTGCHLLNDASERPAYLIMMTDGEPTVGETSESKILKSVAPKREVRIFDFGVGYDVNTRFLNKLAEDHHGTSQYIEPSENLEIAVSNFYQKIKSPILSDVKIEYDGIQTKDVYPREVKDIFAGSQVMLLGKFKDGGKCNVRLTGKVNGVQKAYSFPLAFQSEETSNTYLPRLWAMRRIGHLTDVAHDNGNSREVVDEIVALSKKYGIITEFTSFLVTDPSENNLRLGHMPMRPLQAADASAVHGGFGAGLARGTVWAKSPASAPGMVSNSEAQSFSLNRSRRKALANSAPAAPAHFEAALGAPSDAFAVADKATVRDQRQQLATGDFETVTGMKAVKVAKSANELKQSDYIADAGKDTSASVKAVADKTFYLRGGVWVDSTIDMNKASKPKEITFASKEYFDLIHLMPSIAKYLSVGQQVLLQFNGQIYKIVSGVTTTG